MRLECLETKESHKGCSWYGENCSYLINICEYFNNNNKVVLVLPFLRKKFQDRLPISFAFITNQNEVWVCYNYDPSINLISL